MCPSFAVSCPQTASQSNPYAAVGSGIFNPLISTYAKGFASYMIIVSRRRHTNGEIIRSALPYASARVQLHGL